MTEELKQKARQKALEWNDKKINGKYNRPPIANWACYEKGYIAGATEATKELEAQIEKMKCCEMCKNYNWQGCVFSSEERLDCINNKRKLFELKG